MIGRVSLGVPPWIRQRWLTVAATLISVAIASFLAAWLMATRPFDAPDEQAHYLRALTITHGQLLGPKVSNYRLVPPGTPEAAWQRTQQAWVDHDTRALYVPARLSPPGVNCLSGALDSRGCVEATPTGDYPPLAYLLPAVALRHAPNPTAGVRLGRAAAAIPVLLFFLIAVTLAASIGPWALLGLLAAITPMVLFVGSILNSSGLDIAASAACAAATLRIATDPRRASGSVWVALATSAVVAVLSWQLGPWFVLLTIAIGLAIGGSSLTRELRLRRRRSVVVGAAILGAYALSLLYGLSSGVIHAQIHLMPVGGRVKGGITELFNNVLPQAVGNFGWLSVRLPDPAYWIWWVGVLALVGGALWLGRRRDRLVVAAAVLIALGFPVLFEAFIYSQSGFGLQGRQVLPVLMLVPLLAGVVIERNAAGLRLTTARVVPITIAAIAGFQLFAWWIQARTSAGEPSAVWFLAHPAWSPPGGWWPWMVLAIAGTACLALGALTLLMASQPSPLSPDGAAADRSDLQVEVHA